MADFTSLNGYNVKDSVARAKLEKNAAPAVDVKFFGAKGDGTTNDTAAIRAALSYANNVYFPAGRYIVDDTIALEDNKHIFGDGPELSIIEYTGANFLFNITSHYKKQAEITGLGFSGGSNGFIRCGLGKWGGSFILRDFAAYQFNDEIIRLESTFNVLFDHGIFGTYGKFKLTTFDGTATGVNICNDTTFNNVYINKYSDDPADYFFDIFNTHMLTFNGCALENVGTFLKSTGQSKTIRFADCWLENVENIFDVDSTSNHPTMENCHVVNNNKRNKNATVVDFMRGANVHRLVNGSTNIMNTLFNDNNILDSVSIENPTDDVSAWFDVYKLTGRGATFNVPLNKVGSLKSGVTTNSVDLGAIMRWSSMHARFRVTVYSTYSGGSYRWQEIDVLKIDDSYMVSEPREVKAIVWDGSGGYNATESLTVTNGVATFTSSDSMNRCYMFVDYDILPKLSV